MNRDLDPSVPAPWLAREAPDRDVVLSSRVRFARNLDNYPFEIKASAADKERIREDVHDVLHQQGEDRGWKDAYVDNLSQSEKNLFVERRLASEELMNEPTGGLFYTQDESLGIMVNEEDHVRVQSICPGNRIDDAFEAAHEVERTLDQHLPFAFDEQWGFLTSCPTNLGTGLRASLLLHLPGLVMSQKIDRVLKAVSNLGLTVRGFAGEGSESRGFYFQLSNQVTLGQSAEEMRDNLERVSHKIVDQERQARQSLMRSKKVETLDQIWRSYGILKYAKKIDSTEAIETLSYCRLGVDLDLFGDISLETIDGLLFLTQPAHLVMSVDDRLGPDERDFHRAKTIRGEVSGRNPSGDDPGSSSSNPRPRES